MLRIYFAVPMLRANQKSRRFGRVRQIHAIVQRVFCLGNAWSCLPARRNARAMARPAGVAVKLKPASAPKSDDRREECLPYYFVARISPAALSPLSRAPCAVEKKFGEVASPAKNKRPSTGEASTARAPAWPGRACE